MTRLATKLTATGINLEARTVDLTFSSEAPAEQFFGIEILSHKPGAIRTQYLDNHAALLWNHDWDTLIGVVDSWRVESGQGHATVRFSKNERGNEVFNDVVDNIITHVSVGYRILDMQLESVKEGQPDVWRITDWLPMEISMVSIPADLNVGVARDAANEPQYNPHQLEVIEMKNRIMRSAMNATRNPRSNDAHSELPAVRHAMRTMNEATPGGAGGGEPATAPLPAAVSAAITSGVDAARTAMVAILALGAEHGASADATQFIQSGRSLDQFRTHLLDKLKARTTTAPTTERKATDLDLSAKERGQYSLMRLATAAAEGKSFATAAPFELECSNEIEKRLKRQARGLYLPWDIQNEGARSALVQLNMQRLQSKTLGTQPGEGGQLVDTEYRPDMFVELLRNITVMGQLGATYIDGLVGDLEIPRRLTSSAAYWVNEDEAPADSGTTFGNFKMDPKSIACAVPITKRLMKQSSPAIEGLVRTDMATTMALGVDNGALYGRGLTTYKEPLGILLQSGTSFVTVAAANQLSYAEGMKFHTKLITNNAISLSTPKWLMTPVLNEYMATTPKVASTDSVMINDGPTFHGFPKIVSNQMQNSAKARGMVLAQWNEMLIGLWGVTDLVFDTTTKVATQGLIIRMFQDLDVAVRQPTAFVKGLLSGD